MNRLPALDAVRAVAILLVVSWHYQAMLPPYYTVYGEFGPFWRDDFFVLSGYLITALLAKEYQTTGTVSI